MEEATTAREQAEEAERALQAQVTQTRGILDTATDGIITITERGIVESFNPAASRIFGYLAEEVVGHNISMLLPQPHRDRHDQYLARYCATGETHILGVTGRELEGQRKDGSCFPLDLSVSEVNLADRRLFTGVMRDTTARKRAEAELMRQAQELQEQNLMLTRKNKELDEFTYIASHDLQEPIRNLLSYGTLLRQDLGDDLPQDAADDLYYITDSAKRMKRLVEDLLALSRAGRSAMKHDNISLDECVDNALTALATCIQESNATICRARLPTVLGDKTLLTQLYQNLIGNAVKFQNSAAPQIELTAEQQNGTWMLGVQDNGIGIDPQYAERIFNPFQRLHGMTEYEGTGIGLSICQKTVERHGGRIWVESELGKGAHVRFTLPRTS